MHGGVHCDESAWWLGGRVPRVGRRGIQRFGGQQGRKEWAREPERKRRVRQERNRESTLSGEPSENTSFTEEGPVRCG